MQTTNSPFSFSIARKDASSNDAPLFSTRGQRLIFKVHAMLPQSQIENADEQHRFLCVEISPELRLKHLRINQRACISRI